MSCGCMREGSGGRIPTQLTSKELHIENIGG